MNEKLCEKSKPMLILFRYHSDVIHIPLQTHDIRRPVSICPLVSSEYSEYSCIHGSFPTLAKYTRYCKKYQPSTFSYVFISAHFQPCCNILFSYATLELVLKHIWTYKVYKLFAFILYSLI